MKDYDNKLSRKNESQVLLLSMIIVTDNKIHIIY